MYFLEHPKTGTRRVLRGLASIGDLATGAVGVAVSDTAAAARRSAKMRTVRAILDSENLGEGEVVVETGAGGAESEEKKGKREGESRPNYPYYLPARPAGAKRWRACVCVCRIFQMQHRQREARISEVIFSGLL